VDNGWWIHNSVHYITMLRDREEAPPEARNPSELVHVGGASAHAGLPPPRATESLDAMAQPTQKAAPPGTYSLQERLRHRATFAAFVGFGLASWIMTNGAHLQLSVSSMTGLDRLIGSGDACACLSRSRLRGARCVPACASGKVRDLCLLGETAVCDSNHLLRHAHTCVRFHWAQIFALQSANIYPFLYMVLNAQQQRVRHATAIWWLLVLGILGALLMSALWRQTAEVFGKSHSVGALWFTSPSALSIVH
jgi:hypothetical protein